MKAIPALVFSALVSSAVIGAIYTIDRFAKEHHATAAAEKLRTDVDVLAGRLEQSVNHQLQLTRGLAAFVRTRPEFTEEDFQRFAGALTIGGKGILSLQLAPNGVVTFMTNKTENAKALGHDLLADPKRRHLVKTAIDNRKYVIAGPINLIQGGVAIIARLPIFMPTPEGNDSFWGFATILIDPAILIREAGILDGLPGVNLALRGKDALGKKGAVFYGDPTVFHTPVVEVPITLAAGSWSLGATWVQARAYRPDWLPWIWIGGAAIAIVSGVLLFFVLRQPERLRTAVDRATYSLQESENLLDSVFQNMPVGLLIKDADYVVKQSNNTYLDWYGLSAREIIGHRSHEIENFQPAQDAELMKSQEQQVFLTGKVQSRQVERQFGDGKNHVVNITKFPVFDTDGNITKVGSVSVDVTELVEAQKQAEQARGEAELASRAKSAFLANMSHELRTPLNAIIGFSEAILAQIFGPIGSERYREQVEAIHQSGHHLLDLVNDILDMSKIESETYELSPEPFNFKEIVAETFQLIQATADRNHVELVMQLPDAVSEVTADKRAIKQVLLNLVSNAVKFTPDGGTVVVSATSTNNDLTLSVEDNGVGIPANDIPEVTKPFIKDSHNRTYTSTEGTGLGLSIVVSLVRLHHGELQISSEIGEGTRVSVYLPDVIRDSHYQIAG